MNDPFGSEYAAAYDAFYKDKDYDAECDLLEGIFKQSGRAVKSVLDLGCGTGAHAVRLAQRGYEVIGVDLSLGMLEAAERRAKEARTSSVSFVHGDVRSVRLDKQFDAVICMFAVLGYQTEDPDVQATMETVRGHITRRGPFVFDVWYGPAVEAIGPSTRLRFVETVDGILERQASAVLQPENHLCTVSYRLIHRSPGRTDTTSTEIHSMRYFFKDELERFLREAGLSLEALVPFPDTTASLSDDTWNVLATASA